MNSVLSSLYLFANNFGSQVSSSITSKLFWAVVVLAVVYFATDHISQLSKFAKTIILISQVAVCLYIVHFLFGFNLQAQWGFVDDHEIMHFIGSDYRTPINKVLPIIKETEIARFGEYPRFRPSYYLIRISETLLWGKNYQLWYGSRLLLLAASLLIFWRTISKIFGRGLSFVFLIKILELPFWSDLFTRLGPAETYAVGGLALYVWGYATAISSDAKENNLHAKLSDIAYFIGGLVTIGVKENFIFLGITSFLLLIMKIVKKEFKASLLISSVIHLIYCIVVLLAIFIATGKTGVDIYSNTIDLPSRSSLLLNFLAVREYQYIIFAYIILVLYKLKKTTRFHVSKLLSSSKIFNLLLLLCCISYLVFNFIYYNGGWPNGTRYDFPGMPLLYIISAYLIFNYYQDVIVIINRKWLKILIISIYIIYASMTLNIQAFRHHQASSHSNVLKTKAFTKKIEQQAQTLVSNPSHELFIVTNNPADFELINSYERFLRSLGAKNSMALITQFPNDLRASALDSSLAKQLIEVEKNGYWSFLPASQIRGVNCFNLVLSGQGLTHCLYL